MISRRKYRKLVRLGVSLLRNADQLGSDAEKRVSAKALEYLPVDMPDRRLHADDLALEAITDAAAVTGRESELDSPDW